MSNEQKVSKTPKAPKVKFFDTEDTLLKQSVAVVFVSIVMGIIISLIDVAAQYGVNFLTM